MAQIAYEDFDRVEMRVGRIVGATVSAQARKPSYRLSIDFGDGDPKTSSAQLTVHYAADDLIGRIVLAVTNFPPKRIADVTSEVLVLGVPDQNGDVVLIGPDREVPLGGRLF